MSSQADANNWSGITDKRPTDNLYASICQHVNGSVPQKDEDLLDQVGWEVREVIESNTGYVGVVYYNSTERQVVAVHRTPAEPDKVANDVCQISDSNTAYVEAAFQTANCAHRVFRLKTNARLSFTGYAVGGLLAELCVDYCARQFQIETHAVTFDSPGSADELERFRQLHGPTESPEAAALKELHQLDITCYLSYPHFINTCRSHVGSLFTFKTNVFQPVANGANHIGKIVKKFNDGPTLANVSLVSEWPTWKKHKEIYESVKFEGGACQIPPGSSATYLFKKHAEFDVKLVQCTLGKNNLIALRHFNKKLREFLTKFWESRREVLNCKGENALTDMLKRNIEDETIIKYLGYKLLTADGQVQYVELESEPHKFRRDVSIWLEKNHAKVDKLLEEMNEPTNNSGDMVALVRTGAIITENALLDKNVASAFSAQMPKDASADVLQFSKDLSNQILTGDVKLRVSVVEKGAKVSGKLTNNVVKGIDISFT